MASSTSPSRRTTTNGDFRRPSITRGETTPARMMNGHFASVGEEGTKEQYEHGIQVVDEEKVFKYDFRCTQPIAPGFLS